MGEKEIIDMWRHGYTVKQILDKHPLAKMLKKEGKDIAIVQNRIETAILKYQKGEIDAR